MLITVTYFFGAYISSNGNCHMDEVKADLGVIEAPILYIVLLEWL